MVVLSPQFELTIGKYKVNGISSAVVRMSRKMPADICELEFPNHRDLTLEVFEEGDEVNLSLGFLEFNITPVFTGTIKDIEPNLPLRITCESIAGAARKNAYKETYANSTWKDIAKDALSKGGMSPQLSPFKPSTDPPKKFRVDGQTPAQVLDTIAEETGWVWYAIPGTEDGYFGPPGEQPQGANKTIYKFIVGQNAYSDDCEIEYIKDRPIKKVIVTLTDGNFKEPPATGEYKARDYEDGDAEKKLEFLVGFPSKERAEARAEEEYLRLSTSGFKGRFRAVGNPYIQQGLLIALKVPKYDENTRRAVVESIKHIFGDCDYEIDVSVAGGYE